VSPPKLQTQQPIQILSNVFSPFSIDVSILGDYACLPPSETPLGRNEDSNLEMTPPTPSTSPSFPAPAFEHPEDNANGNIGYAIPSFPYSSHGCTASDESSCREEEPFITAVDYDRENCFGSPLGGGYGVDGEYDDYFEFISKALIEIAK
jgi:hypothetical protein